VLVSVVGEAAEGNQPLDTDDKGQFWLLLDVEGSLLSAQASQSNLLTLGIAVLLDVGLGALEDNTALLFVCLSDQTCQRASLQNCLLAAKFFRRLLLESDPKDG
jgi:hypothetical protein